MKGQGSAVSFRRYAREERNKNRADARNAGGGFYPGGSPAWHSLKSDVFHRTRAMSQPPFQTPASYEAALAELEQLVGRIESGQLPLEELLTGYQRGAQLLQFCRDKLQAVENQIKVLDEGVLKPWTQE
jgi:exodeoxyribonuclease VII small subunit